MKHLLLLAFLLAGCEDNIDPRIERAKQLEEFCIASCARLNAVTTNQSLNGTTLNCDCQPKPCGEVK